MSQPHTNIVAAEPAGDYRLRHTFDDGVEPPTPEPDWIMENRNLFGIRATGHSATIQNAPPFNPCAGQSMSDERVRGIRVSFGPFPGITPDRTIWSAKA